MCSLMLCCAMPSQTLEAEKSLLSTELERASAKSQELFEEKCKLTAHLQVDRANFDAMCASPATRHCVSSALIETIFCIPFGWRSRNKRRASDYIVERFETGQRCGTCTVGTRWQVLCRLEMMTLEKAQKSEELQRAQGECREAKLKLSSAQEKVADGVEAVSAAHRAADERCCPA